uniref:F-box domain-containing protein n=1 Tax=Panagrellus redivivus TaxID=6233 RepID=A0A7E4UVC5_PANRE
MPYPILTLPYPFAKRLSQLLSPSELKNLQIAADLITVGPQKVVNILKNKILCKCEYAFFNSLSDAVFENHDFNNTHYAANIVTFKNCKVGTNFLENMAKKLRQSTELYFEDKCEIDKSIKFPIIFNLFPFLNTLYITTACNGWVRELVDANPVTKIHIISIEHDNLDELLGFDSEDILSLHEQHPQIFLSLTYMVHGPIHEGEEYFEKRIREAFDLPKDYRSDIYFEARTMNQTENSDLIYWCYVDDF